MKNAHKIYPTVFLVALLLCAFFLISLSFRDFNHFMSVNFLYVGQGDSALVRSPNGNHILIDGGPGKETLRALGDVLSYSQRKIDVVILTHPDIDHVGGLPEILERYEVKRIIDPIIDSTNSAYVELKKIASEKGVLWVVARKGEVVDLGGGVGFRIIFPDRDVSHGETNAGSVVGRLEYGNTKILFMGDTPKSVEEYLVQYYPHLLQADVIKIGHHGSHTSSGEKFIKTVGPIFAVISAGKDNKFGHPHKEVVDLLDMLHVSILGTYASGTVEFVSDGMFVKSN